MKPYKKSMYNCLIADYNAIDRKVLELHLRQLPMINLVASCADGREAAAILTNENIDIVFSEIELPGFTGMDLIQNLTTPPAFIFVTSHPEYAVKSFELNAVDFILKPYVFTRLYKAVTKAIEYGELKQLKNNLTFSESVNLAQTTINDDHFFIRESHGITKLKYADVLYIESQGDFSKLHTTDSETHLTWVSLKYLTDQLPSVTFKRVHKQFLVNVNHVTTITGNSILLSHKRMVPLGLMYKQPLLEQIVNKKIITKLSENSPSL